MVFGVYYCFLSLLVAICDNLKRLIITNRLIHMANISLMLSRDWHMFFTNISFYLKV